MLAHPTAGGAISRVFFDDQSVELRMFVHDLRPQILQQRPLTHVLNNGLGRVVGALVLVVLKQVLEDVAKHLGVDTDFVLL